MPVDEIRAADGEQAGHVAAAALADDQRLAAVLGHERLELLLEPATARVVQSTLTRMRARAGW